MARDLLHQIVKESLMKDGWTITHDPYRMEDYDPEWEIDMLPCHLLFMRKIFKEKAYKIP